MATRPAGALRPQRRAQPTAASHWSRPLPVLWFTKNDEVFTYGIVRRGELVLLTLGCRQKTVAAGDSGLSSLKLGDDVGSLRWSSGFGDTVYDSVGSWGSSSFSRSGAEGCQAAGRRRRIRGKCTMYFGAQGGC
jgi:hypothetical protein